MQEIPRHRRARISGRIRSASAFCLAVAFGSYLIGILTRSDLAVDAAAILILIFLCLNLPVASVIVRTFFIVAIGIAVAGLWGGALGPVDIERGADRLAFLSCLLIALVFLRLVAGRDDHFFAAGSFLANQPPSRRYVSLGIGGNIFGVLLNLGGLGLLVEMTLNGQRRTEAVNGVTVQVHEIRERRIVGAIVRGFATIAFWSPFGIALNTLLLIFPDLHWRDFAPWGLGFASIFLATGAVIDFAGRHLRPIFPRPVAPRPLPGEGRGMLTVVGHLVALSGIVITLDLILPLPFQDVLVAIVPLYALVWIVWLRGLSGPALLAGDFITNAPRYVNEIGVFALAGLIGALLAGLIPRDALDPLLGPISAGGGPVLLTLALMWGTLLAAMIGLHPIITVAILGELMLRSGSLSDTAVVLALLSGWACTVCLAPLATTATYVGAIVDRSPITVTWRWNGVFGIVVAIVLSLCLSVGISLNWF